MLISPGVEVQVIDESQYAPNVSGSVPFVVIATAQDKQSGTGVGVATGTTLANAGKVAIVSSQRELVSLYGKPVFKRLANGTPIHGSELNEYGLMTAYSLLGVTNRVYVQRANIDLAELEGTSVRPTRNPEDGVYWLNTANTLWGVFEWTTVSQGGATFQSFVEARPRVIVDATDVVSSNDHTPKSSIGSIGEYAVVAINTKNRLFFKNYLNEWVAVGTKEWQDSRVTVSSTVTNPELTPGDKILINNIEITLSGIDVASLVNDINSNVDLIGVRARNNSGKLELYVTAEATLDGSSQDGRIVIADELGDTLVTLGITEGTYNAPSLAQSDHTKVPRWRTTDPSPRPAGSVWIKTSAANNGASFDLNRYSEAVAGVVSVAAPLYENDQQALQKLDPIGGGLNIGAGTVYVQYDVDQDDTATYKLYVRAKQGTTTVVGSVADPEITPGTSFTIQASQTGVETLTAPVTITASGSDADSLVADILAANIPNVTAQVTSSGALSITHIKGGILVFRTISNPNPLSAAGISPVSTYVRLLRSEGSVTEMVASNYVDLEYTIGSAAPNSDPADGRLWYYSETKDVDIMIHDGSGWVGYQNETADARGYDLSITNPGGPFVAASAPLRQDDGTALEYGDLWIDTSDLDNYPLIKRWSNVNGESRWVTLNNADQTSEDGVLFADARWDTSGTTNVVVGAFPSIVDMLRSDYLDPDAPNPDLYPRGTLLFNTRRSGYNVKRFARNYFNSSDFAGALPSERDTWVTASGLQDDGSPYMGRKAVRQMVVAAMKAALASNTELREEQREFQLMAAPGYPELIPSLVSLNNDRKNTAFVIGDTPMRLPATGTAIYEWATNAKNKPMGEEALTVGDPYVGLFYPCGQTNDLDGNTIVVPSSHIAMYTMIRSDSSGYPWFAAAGVRRGLVGNVAGLGYVDPDTEEFVSATLNPGLRDAMYETKINPITILPGVGQVVYGNKTLGPNGSALDRINVARLVVYLRRVLDLASRNFVFEPNDKITRDEIKQVIERAMNDLVAKRAITDYVVVCDESNNTPIRRDRNELWVDVAIEPVKAVEFIYVPLRIKSQGAISGS